MKQLLRYMKETCKCSLRFEPDAGLTSTVFVESDSAGDLYGRKSTSGMVTLKAGTAVSWYSQ